MKVFERLFFADFDLKVAVELKLDGSNFRLFFFKTQNGLSGVLAQT